MLTEAKSPLKTQERPDEGDSEELGDQPETFRSVSKYTGRNSTVASDKE